MVSINAQDSFDSASFLAAMRQDLMTATDASTETAYVKLVSTQP
jgi:hypothetical protein